jgi:excinuclease ABC subunit A
MVASECPLCHGKRLRRESLSVMFAGMDIADISRIPLKALAKVITPFSNISIKSLHERAKEHPEKAVVTQRITQDLLSRLGVLLDLGLGYLTLERSTPTLSPGELQRLRLATQVHSNLFGVVYVLDEPSAGLHPADTG